MNLKETWGSFVTAFGVTGWDPLKRHWRAVFFCLIAMIGLTLGWAITCPSALSVFCFLLPTTTAIFLSISIHGFLNIWNQRKRVFPPLIALSVLAWIYHYNTLTLASLYIALLPTITTLIFAFNGLLTVEYIESTGDLAATTRLVTQSLVGILLVLGVVFYLGAMLYRIVPPPPLPFLLAIMFAVPLAPYVTLLMLLPPLIGYIPRVRPKWVALRRKYPFWAIYLGVLAGLFTIAIPIMFPELLVIGGFGIRILAMGSSLFICSALLALAPRKLTEKTTDFVTSCLGYVMILMGVLLWLGASGGLFFGSIFAILGGAHAHGWQPTPIEPAQPTPEAPPVPAPEAPPAPPTVPAEKPKREIVAKSSRRTRSKGVKESRSLLIAEEKPS